ncbi:class IV adenylate cyclase [Halopelagius longus]|uniref:Adenylate cyclase n=1 Tax=Halopelagius longus TaxID=1236180 RepID=A0A1H1AEI6_9EURY|nr:class IV adenylate cyclase [Halopelagius longus]RDI72962.1 class IV adenylate cyclase [Halopelagius longus]SDQ38092.1 adenylate cyclase [Halopelagius longus]
MYEVEVKVRADRDGVRAKLDDGRAERVGRVRQVDTYYDAPHRDFAATDEALRIRRETRLGDGDGEKGDGETTARVTYKGPLVEAESKTRAEHETEVADGGTMDAVLDGLGFEPAATVEKEREFYRVDGYTVTLDAVEGVGEFVEIEREAGSEADVESVREGAYAVARELGLDPGEQIRTSYLGMLLGSEE